MKKSVIWIIIIVVILVASALVYSLISGSKNKCAKFGEVSFNDATGKIVPCCNGLNAISPRSGVYDPSNKYADKDGCIWADGYGSYCSNIICGDGVCNMSTENICTCPSDCKNNNYTCPNATTINCMPPGGSSMCYGDYSKWITENCNVSLPD